MNDPTKSTTRTDHQDVEVLYDQLQDFINSGELQLTGLGSQALTIMPQSIDGSSPPVTSE